MSVHHRQRGNWQSKYHIEDQFHGVYYRSGETLSLLYYGEFPWLLTGSYTAGKSCPNLFFTVKARFLVVFWRAHSLTGQPFLWYLLLLTGLACFRINLRDLFLWLSVRALPESLNWEEKTLSQRGCSDTRSSEDCIVTCSPGLLLPQSSSTSFSPSRATEGSAPWTE